MNWKYFFTKNNLERGKALGNNNRVTNLTQESDALYTATVQDESKYNVSIEKKQNSSLYVSCDCEISKRQNCPHMAAVLFKMEESFASFTNSSVMGIVRKITSRDSGTKETQVTKILSNITETPQDPFPPFSRPTFFNFNIVKNSFTFGSSNIFQAFKMINNIEIVLNQCESGYIEIDSTMVLKCSATWKCENNSSGSVNLVFSNTHVYDFSCKSKGSLYDNYQCRSTNYDIYEKKSTKHNESEPLCVHKTALAILVYRYIEENNPGDLTDSIGSKILKIIRSSLPFENKNSILKPDYDEKRILNIVPVLLINGKDLSLRFKAGYDKLFYVEDLYELFESYKTHSVYSINNKTDLIFSDSSVSKQSAESIEFLNNIYSYEINNGEININNHINYFFQYFRDGEVYDINMNKIDFKDSKLHFNSKITQLSTGDNLSALEVFIDIPTIIQTSSYYYTYNPDTRIFTRILPVDIGILKPVIKEISENKKFIIGSKQIRDFSYRVLPVLQTYGNVDISSCQDSFKDCCNIEPAFSFDIDYENGEVLCKATVSYGTLHFDLIPETIVNIDSNRDITLENNVSSLLFTMFSYNSANTWITSDSDKIYNLLLNGLNTLMATGIVNVSNSFDKLKVKKASKIITSVSIDGNMLDLEITTDNMTTEDFIELLESYKSRKRYHRLKNGSFIDIKGENLDDWSVFIDALQLKKKDILKDKIKVPLYRTIYIDSLLEENSSIQINKSDSFVDFYTQFYKHKENNVIVPESLNKTLRQYQKDGFSWLNTLYKYGFGGILADEMGLGKTVQLLSLILSLKERKLNGTTLVVCPASLVYNWEAEIKKFTPSLSVCVISGKQHEREILIKKCKDYDIAVTSYDLLKRDIVFYTDIRFQINIIDEAQYIKNNTTEASKCVKLINSNIRFALTGTPIENRLSELWSIFDFLMPSFLLSKDKFKREFETPIMKLSDESVSEKLCKLTAPFILRRLKSDVLKELPEKLEEEVTIHLNDEQRKIYDANVILLRNMIKGKDSSTISKEKIQILAQLTKLRQICCDPNLVFENYDGSSSKLDACVDLIERASDSGHRMLVFSQFTSMLALIQKELDTRKIKYYLLTGSTSKEDRVTLVNSFNKDNTVPVFLISLKAGGTGLNLTGADVVIHYDPWWNTAVQNQATDRVHRIGQEKIVTVYNLIASETIEEKIIQMQKTKNKIADSILSNQNSGISQLTKEELLEILS